MAFSISFHFIKLLVLCSLSIPAFAVANKFEPEKKILKVRSDIWCPFSCEKGDRPGIMVEIVKHALEKRGYIVDYDITNWARAISETRDGKFDGIVGAAVSDAPDFVFPKLSIASASYMLYVHSDSPWKYTGSFAGKRIGVINAYSYDDLVNELIAKKDPAFVTVSGEEGLSQLIKMLRANRIDAFYENPAVLREWISQNKSPASEFKAAGAPQHRPQDLFVAFGPKLKEGPELAKYIDLEIKAMKKNGSFKKLLSKYHLN